MINTIRSLAIALVVVFTPAIVLADDPPPTPAQLEQAKKAFLEGKKLHEDKKYDEAIAKFSESYRLSKKPALLFNIALTMEEAGQEDLALMKYRQYMKDAAPDDAQRPVAQEHLAALEKKLLGGIQGTKDPVKDPVKDPPKGPVQIKPPGTYGEKDFQHQIVDTAPPGKPLDITAFVPEDSGFVVTLNFRTAGEGKFTSKPMKWRYKELVGRIPAPKMIGNAVHYYIEVKDTAGTLVTRSGKAASPNLINLEAGAQPRFYPDFTEDGEVKPTTVAEQRSSDDDDDPLHKGQKKTPKVVALKPTGDEPIGAQPVEPGVPGSGFRDVGSQKFKYAKWGSTIATATFLGLGAYFYINAGQFATSLENESKKCGAPPCASFDDYDHNTLEQGGKTRQTLSNVTIGIGAATAVVAAYFWYRELTAKKHGELKASSKKAPTSPEAAWIIAPSVGESFMGAAAAARF